MGIYYGTPLPGLAAAVKRPYKPCLMHGYLATEPGIERQSQMIKGELLLPMLLVISSVIFQQLNEYLHVPRV